MKNFLYLFSLTLTAFIFISCASSSQAAKASADSPPLRTRIDADDPLIRYTGRIDFSNPKAPSFAFPAIQIEAVFEGTSIDVVLADMGDRNWYGVSIDGGENTVIQSAHRSKIFEIARNLPDGLHTIRIWKRTEALCGTGAFEGFLLDEGKKLSVLPPPPVRKMEFIGDSITCGFGNLVSTVIPADFRFSPKNEDSSIAWGALTAKALGAQYMAIAYSGRGMFRNIDGSEAGILPSLYGTIFPDNPLKASWDTKCYAPDVIVINLGTNDYSSPYSRSGIADEDFDRAYTDAYRFFIGKLREIHGRNVTIVCAVGPMLTDLWPIGLSVWSRSQDTVGGLVDELKGKGDSSIYYLCLEPQSSPWGEDWHPSAKTHRRMADTTAEFIRKITGW